ncbi:sortase-like acyltransferase [Rhizobium leguminosarum bv. trifolii WSM2297]|uniref:Sortase-like acyltransferase n=1 Tax=Rhizobium leguminosarum bv. trifolii WSM2297 TaxID=754762 RepID=J0WF55_RHILT|nr:GNAT family N-acetyltransferase [Rhizobium leguminosarum]EJC83833.1 sortase-like acyltransferase [Rhizobium leguminosarum bv. trifolii WSM2297]EJC84576.1 sortase-like acyltransferase [Rhizobium leguminosarum bv. trifolii WSM2297]
MHVRKAARSDAEELSALLNEIIRAGGTTALETPLSAAEFADWFIDGEFPLVCHVAEHNQSLVGFQSLSVYGDPPKGVADIATFARVNSKTPGVGSALFPATRDAAKELGLEFINATIRADNVSGLGYYAKMGFETYDRLVQVPLQDGTPVDRIKKRFRVGAGDHTAPHA